MRIKREIFSKLKNHLQDPKILILVGPRQVGKTFLMQQLYDELKTNHKCSYFNIEIPSDMKLFSQDSEIVFNLLQTSGDYVFIDEFHYLKNITQIFKAIYDSNSNVKIIASGSSSIEIHKHLKESLAGRVHIERIFPLSYNEYLQKKPIDPFYDYVCYGALPGLVNIENNDDKIEYLNNLVSTYIMKDIKGLIKEQNISAFNNLLFILAETQGSTISINSLSRDLKISVPTIQNYLNILDQTYIVFKLNSYSKNLSNELKKSSKYFFYDEGIRNLLLKDFSNFIVRNDIGIIAESYIYLNLRKQLKPNYDLFFWRTKQGDEVDFIVIKDRIPFPIEVKNSLKSRQIPSGLKKFMDKYPDAPYGIVYNRTITTQVSLKDGRLIFFEKLEESANSRIFM